MRLTDVERRVRGRGEEEEGRKDGSPVRCRGESVSWDGLLKWMRGKRVRSHPTGLDGEAGGTVPVRSGQLRFVAVHASVSFCHPFLLIQSPCILRSDYNGLS